MKRRGQFYLVAVIVLIAIFFSMVTLRNSLNFKKNSLVFDIEEEIEIEKSKMLDFVVNNDLSNIDSENYLINFSKIYSEKIGKNKDSIFIVGRPDSVKILGYNTNKTPIYYGTLNEKYKIETLENFEYSLTPLENNVFIQIYDDFYNFTMYPGINVNYIINYIENDEIHISSTKKL